MKTRNQIARESLEIIYILTENPIVQDGGIDSTLEQKLMKDYNKTLEEISNLEVIAHALLFEQIVRITN